MMYLIWKKSSDKSDADSPVTLTSLEGGQMNAKRVWRPLNTYGLMAIGAVASSTIIYNIACLIGA